MKLFPLSLFVRSAKMTIPCWKILLRVVAMYNRLSIPLTSHIFWFSNHLSSAPGRSSGRSGRSSRPLVDHLAHDVFQAGGKVAASVVLNHFLPMDTRDYFYYQVIFFHAEGGSRKKHRYLTVRLTVRVAPPPHSGRI